MTEDSGDLEDSEELCSKKGMITDACILEYEVETNGFHGGDSGHGGYLAITFTNEGGAAISVTVPNTAGVDETYDLDTKQSVMVTMRGDAEIRTMVTALKHISNFLEKVLGAPK